MQAQWIMNIGFFACFHGISLERSRFGIITFYFSGSHSSEAAGIANRSPRSLVPEHRHTDKPNTCTVTLAAHAGRGLIVSLWVLLGHSEPPHPSGSVIFFFLSVCLFDCLCDCRSRVQACSSGWKSDFGAGDWREPLS